MASVYLASYKTSFIKLNACFFKERLGLCLLGTLHIGYPQNNSNFKSTRLSCMISKARITAETED